MTTAITWLAKYRRALPGSWAAPVALALALAYGDGFWVTALQGTIGAIERNQAPLFRWMRDSTLMLPLVFLAVLVALLLARRWCGRRHALVQAAAGALLIALISGSIGLAEVGVSSLTDYQYQVKHLELMHSYGAANQPGSVELAGFGAAAPLSYTLYCNLRGVAADSAVALLEYATLMVHVRALYLSALILLLTNLAIAVVLLALYNNRLWAPGRAGDLHDTETASQPAMSGVAS